MASGRKVKRRLIGLLFFLIRHPWITGAVLPVLSVVALISKRSRERALQRAHAARAAHARLRHERALREARRGACAGPHAGGEAPARVLDGPRRAVLRRLRGGRCLDRRRPCALGGVPPQARDVPHAV